jgi:hypothetical protein
MTIPSFNFIILKSQGEEKQTLQGKVYAYHQGSFQFLNASLSNRNGDVVSIKPCMRNLLTWRKSATMDFHRRKDNTDAKLQERYAEYNMNIFYYGHQGHFATGVGHYCCSYIRLFRRH